MDKADISAQVEVQRLQIQILIETVNEKEKEIEKEKQLIAESKEEANTRVIGTEPSLEEAVTGVGEYKDMEEMYSQVVNQNRELFLLLLGEKARLQQYREKLSTQRGNAKEEFFRVKRELEGKTKKGFSEMKAEQQSVDLLHQELELKEQEICALKEEKNRMMNEWPNLQDNVEILSEENLALREYTEGIHLSLRQENIRARELKGEKEGQKNDQPQSSFFGSGLYNSLSSFGSISGLTSMRGEEEGNETGGSSTTESSGGPKPSQGVDGDMGSLEGPSSKQGDSKMGFLPTGQTCLQYFSCCNADLKGGWFHVCEEYIFFETTLKQHEIEGPVVIPIREITQIDKRNMAIQFIPGKGTSISIHTDKKEFLFRSFLQRDAAASLLLKRCAALCHSVRTTRDNQPDDFSDDTKGFF